jgi:lipopolysaccharide export system protein LptA
MRPHLAIILLAALACAGPAAGRDRAAPGRDRASAFGELGTNKEPIKIDADRLDVFDKEGRAVFAGNVVAVQGDSTMKCSALTVFYEQGRGAAQAGLAGGAGGAAGVGGAGGEAIRKIACKGPVTITTKTQVATGDNAEFDRAANKVVLVGNAALSDGPNVTRGERVAYDINTGVANVVGGGGRVRALIVPGSQSGAPNQPPRPRAN